MDTTEQKWAEQKQARLTAILEATSDFVATATPDGTILSCNRALRDFLRITEEDVPKLTTRDFHAACSWERVQCDLMPVTNQEGQWTGESVYISGEGKATPVSLQVFDHTDENGVLLYRTEIARDISAQKATEEALHAAQARAEEAQRIARIGSWDYDVASQKVRWSRELFHLFERDDAVEEPDYRDLLNLFSLEDAIRLDAAVKRAVQEGVAYAFDLRRIAEDGAIYTYHITGNPIMDHEHTVVRLIGSCMDITEREHLEAQVRHMQKMDSIGRLTGGIAHDFNNLLAIIMGYAELVGESLTEAHALHGKIQNIHNAATRAANLTQQLLSFAHKQAISPRVVQPNDVMVQLTGMLKPLVGESIDLILRTDPEAGHLYIDSNQLEQVIVNLVVNARDAMPNGGKLVLTTEQVTLLEAIEHEHVLMPAGSYVVFTVTDNGVGMTKDVKARLFEPFFTTKEKGKGTGLGLATLYGIVKQNKGFTWVYSELGVGTTFKVYLPCVDRAIGAYEPVVQDNFFRDGTETVLVAEGEPALRELIAATLRGRGYRVLEAADGVEALDVLERCPEAVQLLLTDRTMPQMGGIELARKLREFQPDVAVLLASGYAWEMFPGEAIHTEAITLLQKPFTIRDLLQKVQDVLTARG